MIKKETLNSIFIISYPGKKGKWFHTKAPPAAGLSFHPPIPGAESSGNFIFSILPFFLISSSLPCYPCHPSILQFLSCYSSNDSHFEIFHAPFRPGANPPLPRSKSSSHEFFSGDMLSIPFIISQFGNFTPPVHIPHIYSLPHQRQYLPDSPDSPEIIPDNPDSKAFTL